MKPEPTGAELIAAERRRQIEEEGYTQNTDDILAPGKLAAAAECYLAFVRFHHKIDTHHGPWMLDIPDRNHIEGLWPFHPRMWKPSADPLRNLVRAGALIAAEIDRLQRQNQREENEDFNPNQE